MRDDAAAVVVDRGRWPDAVTPWELQAWRDSALGWVERQLAAHGLEPTGRHEVRLRPWSVLVRMPVRGGDAVWFKASPPAGAFEAALGAALARWVPDHVLQPIAVDTDRGWSLLPDGGPRLRDVLGGGPDDLRAWEEVLGRYAEMQRALTVRADALQALGVPGARTRELPEVFDRIVAENTALKQAGRVAMTQVRPRLVEWCGELADVGIGDTLDHADLHDAQVFAPAPGGYRFFDWGDAAVSHPFCSFTVPAGWVRERYGQDALPRLRDAYLEPWTGAGRTTADLRRALRLAWRLGAIGRAGSWGRLFPGAYGPGATGTDDSAVHSLGELLAEPPQLP